MPNHPRRRGNNPNKKTMTAHRHLVGLIGLAVVVLVLFSHGSFGVAAEEEEDSSAAASAATSAGSGVAMQLPSITATDPNESCRLEVLERWRNGIRSGVGDTNDSRTDDGGFRDTAAIAPLSLLPSSTTREEDVLAALALVQDTDVYRSALEDCSHFLGVFHERAETTCNLEKTMSDASYSTFWDVGPINLDGGLLLAADLLVSRRFRDALPLVRCSDSCYVRDIRGIDCQDDTAAAATDFGRILKNNLRDMTMLSAAAGGGSRKTRDDDDGDDSTNGEIYDDDDDDEYRSEGPGGGSSMAWLASFDQQRILCRLEWLEADEAYQMLRLCAAESNVARTTIAALRSGEDGGGTAGVAASDVAVAYAVQTRRQSECHAAVVSQRVCDAFASGVRDDGDQPYGSEMEIGIDIGWVDVDDEEDPAGAHGGYDPWLSGGVGDGNWLAAAALMTMTTLVDLVW